MRFVIVYDPEDPKLISTGFQEINSYHVDVNQAIQHALEKNGHRVDLVCADENLQARLVELKPDFAFNCSSQPRGSKDYAFAPRILKELGIPFTGSGGLACMNAYDKNRAKQMFLHADIRTPKAVVLRSLDEMPPHRFDFPIFIKPVKGGCSFGITRDSLVNDRQTLAERLPRLADQYGQPVLLEEYLPGREFTVGVLGNRRLRILPIMEYKHDQSSILPFRSYKLKMIKYQDEELCCPANLYPRKRKEIEDMARRAFKALGCRDYARIDFRLDRQGRPYILEVNALPNLMPNSSSFAIMARQAGLAFTDLISEIVSTAQTRYACGLSNQ